MDSNNLEAQILQAKILLKEKKADEAIKVLEASLKQQIKDSQDWPKSSTFFYLGQAYEQKKEYKKCLANYKMCLQFD